MRMDSDGEFWNVAAGAFIGAGISMLAEVGGQLASGSSINITDVMFVGINGLISGAVASTGVLRMGQMAINAVVGGAIETTKQVINNKSFKNLDGGKILKATAIGGMSGYLGGDGARARNSSYGMVTKSMKMLKKYTKNNTYSASTLVPYKSYLTSTKKFLEPIVNRNTRHAYYTGTLASLIGNYGRKIWNNITGK